MTETFKSCESAEETPPPSVPPWISAEEHRPEAAVLSQGREGLHDLAGKRSSTKIKKAMAETKNPRIFHTQETMQTNDGTMDDEKIKVEDERIMRKFRSSETRLTPFNEKEDDIKRKEKEGEENRRGRDPAKISGQRTQNGKKSYGIAKCQKK